MTKKQRIWYSVSIHLPLTTSGRPFSQLSWAPWRWRRAKAPCSTSRATCSTALWESASLTPTVEVWVLKAKRGARRTFVISNHVHGTDCQISLNPSLRCLHSPWTGCPLQDTSALPQSTSPHPSRCTRWPKLDNRCCTTAHIEPNLINSV